jgi:hypothetical protein
MYKISFQVEIFLRGRKACEKLTSAGARDFDESAVFFQRVQNVRVSLNL